MRGHRPSPALIIAFLALVIALGGTALAATGQFVNIADPDSPSHMAGVDSTGALQVASASPSTEFHHTATVFPSPPGTILIGPTTSKLALTRIAVSANLSANSARFYLIARNGTETDCSTGAGRYVGVYAAPGRSTTIDEPSTPIVLKPLQAGHVWCLYGYATWENGDTSTHPWVNVSGYAMTGDPPDN